MTRKSGPNGLSCAPVLASDGNAHDADLERRWSSVRGGLLSALESLEIAVNLDLPSVDDVQTSQISSPSSAKKRKRIEPTEWLRMYSDVASLYASPDPLKKRRMYERVREFLKQFVVRQLLALREKLGEEGLLLLKEYKRRWDMSVRFVAFMKRILLQMHNYWIAGNSNTLKEDPVRPLDRLLMFYWREELLANLPEVVAIVLAMIDDDRCGKPIDHGPVKEVIDTLVILGAADIPSERAQKMNATPSFHRDESIESLHLYLQVFEDEFLQRTAAFYASEAEQMMRGNCVSTFMQSVVARLDEEIARGERLLHKDSVSRLRSTVEEKLVGAHMTYLQEEADAMVRDGREQDLMMIFKLLERLEGGLAPVRDYLTKYIVDEGLEILRSRSTVLSSKEDVKKSLVVVEDLITLHKTRTDMINRCFGGAQIFFMGLSDAFRKCMNKSVGALSMAEIIAYYVDCLLRNPRARVASTASQSSFPPMVTILNNRTERCRLGVRGDRLFDSISLGVTDASAPDSLMSLDSPLIQQMDRVIRLFMYLDDKDMFHETYRRLLAKRLLTKHDEEAEQEFITRLKHEMGPAYTGKLHGMYQDVSVSNEERREFNKYCGTSLENNSGDSASKVRFNVHILNALYWPSFQADKLRIPNALIFWEQKFVQCYMRNKEHRKVTWIHSQSTNHVAASMNGRDYTLIVSTFQACALLQFNNHRSRSLSELSKALNVQPASLARYLQPLVGNKRNRILSCSDDIDKLPNDIPGYASDNISTSCPRSDYFAARNGDLSNSRRLQNSPNPETGSQDNAAPNNSLEIANPIMSNDHPEVHHNEIEANSDFDMNQQTQAAILPVGDGSNFENNFDGFESNDVNSVEDVIVTNANGNDNIAAHQGTDDVDGDIYDEDDLPDFDPVIAPVGATRDLPSLTIAASSIAVELQSSGQHSNRSNQNDNVESHNLESSIGISANGDVLSGAHQVISEDPGMIVAGNSSDPCHDRTHQSHEIPNTVGGKDGDTDAMHAGSAVEGSEECANVDDEAGEIENAGAISDCGDDDDDDDTDVEPRVRGDGEGAAEEPVGSNVVGVPEFPTSQEDASSADPATKIVYNLLENFSSKSLRIVYPAVISRITSRGSARARQTVVMDRTSVLDAALVRIMKQRKSLPHNQLIAEVLPQVSSRFKPDMRMLKDRIEQLIEREFLERASDDPNMYKYCA